MRKRVGDGIMVEAMDIDRMAGCRGNAFQTS